MRKKLVGMVLCAAMATTMLAGCGSAAQTTASSAAPSSAAATVASTAAGSSAASSAAASTTSGDVKNIKFYGKVVEYTSGPKMTDALIAKEKGKYNIDAIQVDWANLDKVIRTGIASGDPCDIYNYSPQSTIANFSDMAVDLKPYLDKDPDWKAQFSDKDLAACTTEDGRIICVPWESNFSVILANKDKLDELGITIPDSWTYADFLPVCQKIKDAGYFPFANASDLNRADWIFRNAMLSEVCTAGTYDDFTKGKVSYKGTEATNALKNTKELYDKGYMYPGDGAVTAKGDEVKAAFYQGKLLMMPEIAAGAKVTASQADFNVVAIPWPSSNKEAAILGGLNGFFIPQNCKDVDAAVDVLKAYTNADIMKIHAEEGYIPVNTQVEVTDPFVKTVMAQAATLKSPEDPATAEMNDYKANKLMPDLILNGGVDTAEEQLETLRTAEQ